MALQGSQSLPALNFSSLRNESAEELLAAQHELEQEKKELLRELEKERHRYAAPHTHRTPLPSQACSWSIICATSQI
eukprot:5762583-Prymnesium_polylepis.2